MLFRLLTLSAFYFALGACAPTQATPSSNDDDAVDTGLIAEVSILLSQSADRPRFQDKACAILTDTLGEAAAIGSPDRTGQTGLMGTPIACARSYQTGASTTPVMVYTDPQFVSRIAAGPPPGDAVEQFELQGFKAYATPADPQGIRPAIIVDASPAAVIFVPIFDLPEASNPARALVESLQLGSLRDLETKSAASQPEEDREVQLQNRAERLKRVLTTRLDTVFEAPDLTLDAIGVTPRCLDIGELLFENTEFTFVSVLVGSECVADLPLPNGGEAIRGPFRTVFEQSEQTFDGTFTTRGLVYLSKDSVLSFQADGDQAAADRALRALPLENLSPLL